MIKVNQTEITENQILQEMQYHSAESQRDAMIKASESLVIAELMRQQAEKLAIEMDDQDAFVDLLLEQQIDYPDATDQDCQNYYDNNQEKFKTSPLLAVKHILMACPADDQDQRSRVLEQANQLIVNLQEAPESFEALAKQFSACSSAEVGGSLGQISRGQTVAEFERQLFACDVGLLRAPVETQYGVHIVQVDHREEGKQLLFEQVHERIRDYLNEKVRHKAISQYISTLISGAEITGFEFEKVDQTLFH